MTLTPRWSEIRERNPDAHASLQRVTTTIYEQARKQVPQGELDGLDLDAALDHQLLTYSGDEIGFADQEVLAEYLVRHGVNLAAAAWDDPEAFGEVLSDLQHRSVRLNLRREVGVGVALLLAHEYGKNVVERLSHLAASKGEAQRRSFWMAYDVLCQALPELAADPEELANALEPVLDAVAGDLMSGAIYKAVERLAGRSESAADALFCAFAARSASPVIALAVNALVALAGFDLPEAHRRALALTTVGEPVLRRVGIAALGRFDYAGEAGDALLKSTLERFGTLRGAPDPATDYVLAGAYGDLLRRSEESAGALVDLSSRPDPAVQNRIGFVMMGQADACSREPWFREALFNLATVPTSQTETLGYLDHCAYRWVADDPDGAVGFAEAVALGRDYGREGEDATLPKVLSTTIGALYEVHPQALEAAITRWFASGHRQLHRAATDLIQRRHPRPGGESRRDWVLSKPVLDALDEPRVIHTLERIMGWVVGGRALASLLVSALEREPCPPPLAQFVEAALWEHALYNYPRGGGEYLRERLENGSASAVEAGILRAALAREEEYTASRELPVPTELRPPARRVYLLRLAQQKHHARVVEEAQKKSVILSLVSRVSLKYGRASFSEIEGVLTPPSELSTFSHEVEVPRGELIDPLGQAYHRMQWRSSGMSTGDAGPDGFGGGTGA